MVQPIIPVLLCGGTGSRLWPLSRQSYPKQFLKLNNDKKSLLQNTHLRLNSLDNLFNPILVCNEEHRFIVAEQMREINVEPLSILLEPFGKNTSAAITVAALKAIESDGNSDPLILVLSSDHVIKNEKKFLKVINFGVEFAKKDRLVTFGTIPNQPHTGYGYIKSENAFNPDNISGENILEFTEKPDLETAKEFIKDKRYTWNSGIFLFKAKTILEEVNNYAPDIFKYCKESISKSKLDLDFQRLDKNSFFNCPDISIDFSVMEKTTKGTVLPLDVGWSDIGSWDSVWENSIKNNDGNFVKGKVLTDSTKNCYLSSEERLLVGIGIEELIVVETNDAILISHKSQTQKVKSIVKHLKENKITEGEKHTKIYRPWGHYISIAQQARWQVKMIVVKPNAKLSLQMHHHRSEHWIVVKGTAKVEIDSKTSVLCENESTYIPLGSKHRLSNPGKIPLSIIEIQSGSYLGEDDIVRFEDNYGRLK